MVPDERRHVWFNSTGRLVHPTVPVLLTKQNLFAIAWLDTGGAQAHQNRHKKPAPKVAHLALAFIRCSASIEQVGLLNPF